MHDKCENVFPQIENTHSSITKNNMDKKKKSRSYSNQLGFWTERYVPTLYAYLLRKTPQQNTTPV